MDSFGNRDRDLQSYKESGHGKYISLLHGDAGGLLCDGSHHPRGLQPDLYHRLDVVRPDLPCHGLFCMDGKGTRCFLEIIAAGIAAVSVMSSVLLFDHLRLYDFVIDGVLIYILFFKKSSDHRKERIGTNETGGIISIHREKPAEYLPDQRPAKRAGALR